MIKNIRSLILGDVLSERSKKQLISWLVSNKARLRAGLPANWRVGDKTGSGEHGTTNDVGVAWLPQSEPILITVYLTGTAANAEARNRTIAAVGSAIAATLRG